MARQPSYFDDRTFGSRRFISLGFAQRMPSAMGGSGIRMVSQRGIWTTWVGVLYAFEFGGNIGLHGKMDALINGFMMRKQITMPEDVVWSRDDSGRY